MAKVDYWKKFNKIPFDPSVPENERPSNMLYCIKFFHKRRALLCRRDYSVMHTLETRKARQIVEDAKEKGWIENAIASSNQGWKQNPEHYPNESEITYWFLKK